MQARLIVVTKAAEQKQSKEQKLLQYDDGNNWYGKDPILRLIHTLDETEIWCVYLDCHNLSNERIVLDNAKSVEKREMTVSVWQKMVNVWNDGTFAPLTMLLLPQITTHFVDSRVISCDSDLSAATPEMCAHKFATMTAELQRMISQWSLSSKGDEDLDGYNAGEDEKDVFGSLTRCSQGALDSHANFGGTSQSYILYLWEYLNAHDLLKTSFQRLDPTVAAKNGGKGVPSIIRSQLAKHSPSDESLAFGKMMTEKEDAISWGEQPTSGAPRIQSIVQSTNTKEADRHQ